MAGTCLMRRETALKGSPRKRDCVMVVIMVVVVMIVVVVGWWW